MKSKFSMLAIILLTSAALQAAPKPVTDDLPGLPGQSQEFWDALRAEEQAKADAERLSTFFYTGKPYDASKIWGLEL